MSESGGFHGSDSAQVRHEDKCRWWDDPEFCDCGAEPSQEVIDLRKQLTAALAERDEARERVKGLSLPAKMAVRHELKKAAVCVHIAVEETVAKDLSRIMHAACDEIDHLAAQLDTAWQQSAEAMREAVVVEFQRLSTRDRETYQELPLAEFRQWALDRLRALPVPERKEG